MREIKGVEHYVYEDIDEFRHYHDIKAKDNWRTADEGDWVIADDGGVVQLLKVSRSIKHPNDRKNYRYAKVCCRNVVCTFLLRDTAKMDTDFKKHKNRYTFSGKIKNPNQRIKERSKVTNKEKSFATNVVVGMGAVKAYMDAYGEVDEYKAKKKSALLLKQRRVMSEVEKGVKDIAIQLGIDHEYVLGKLKYLADHSNDENISLQSLKELGKSIGTLGNQPKKIETGVVGLFKGFTDKELKLADRADEIKQIESENK